MALSTTWVADSPEAAVEIIDMVSHLSDGMSRQIGSLIFLNDQLAGSL
jgi:hypothetical protein